MAKRKRLTPAQPEFLAAGTPAPETKSALGPMAPIASVAAEASAAAALRDVTDAMQAARDEGRLVQKIPLGEIAPDHLRRDRMAVDEDEMAALVASIREHGQRSAIEVVALEGGGYGLISGWRRLAALEQLRGETGDARYDSVLAILRRPDSASDAYVAMVEENEIRVGLSYYERARVAALAVRDGVFATEKAALNRLFANASRAKRSKINSFLTVFNALDEVIRFPASLGERQGLALAKAIEAGQGAAISAALRAADALTSDEESETLVKIMKNNDKKARNADVDDQRPPAGKPTAKPVAEELRPGVFLTVEGGWSRPRLTLSGPKVDQDFRAALAEWLRTKDG